MKNLWARHFIAFVLVVASGGVLMHTSQDVQRAERELAHAQNALAQEKEAIRVLETEWAYLNRPERLEVLAAQYLDLVPSGADSLVSSLPGMPDYAGSPDALNLSVVQTRDVSHEISYLVQSILSENFSPPVPAQDSSPHVLPSSSSLQGGRP